MVDYSRLECTCTNPIFHVLNRKERRQRGIKKTDQDVAIKLHEDTCPLNMEKQQKPGYLAAKFIKGQGSRF